MNKKNQNKIVLAALFIVPLVFYLLISTGINNFAKLEIVTPNVIDISEIDSTKSVTFQKNISIVTFLGNDSQSIKGSFFNLNQKIYKPFYGFLDFQMIAIYPKDKKADMEKLKKELGAFTNMVKWKFIAASEEEINILFNSFNTDFSLDENLFTPKAFIIDKEGNLRGRLTDEKTFNGKLFGYNMQSVAELNDKMKDDVKVVLAEYRLALKKNNADREI
jgi:hypothetical protein